MTKTSSSATLLVVNEFNNNNKILKRTKITSFTETTFSRWNIGIKRVCTAPATVQNDRSASIMYCSPYEKTSAAVPIKATDEK